MNTLIKSTLALLVLSSAALAEGEHQHAKAIPGPKGARVVEVVGGYAEFFVLPDRKVSVTFYGEDMKPLPPAEQVVSVVAEAPTGKAKLEFEKTGEGFVSKAALPQGDGYRIVLQIKPDATGKTQNFRIDFHLEQCGECKLAEYACTCAGSTGDGHAH